MAIDVQGGEVIIPMKEVVDGPIVYVGFLLGSTNMEVKKYDVEEKILVQNSWNEYEKEIKILVTIYS